MADHVFYTKGRSKGNQRKITINSAHLLVGKAPTKGKRIKLNVTMGVSTQKHTGAPEWVTNAFEFVAKNHDEVTPNVDFKGYDIGFSVDNLFGEKAVNAPRCQMRGFVVTEQGDAETPDVVLKFIVYAPFATDLWNWLGQMAGEEVWSVFAQAAPDEDEGFELTEEAEDEEEPEDEEVA